MDQTGLQAVTRRRVSALENALSVLRCFSSERLQVTVTQSARLTGLDKGTTSRILRQLADEGLLQEDHSVYRPGWRAGLLGSLRAASCQPANDICSLAYDLARSTGCTVQFGLFNLELQRPIITMGFEGIRRARVAASIGSVIPLHATSVGRAMCAAMSREQLDAALASCDWHRYTAKTLVDEDAFRGAVEQCRGAGCATISGEYYDDQNAVAMIVDDHRNATLQALSILAVPGSFDKSVNTSEYIEALSRTVKSLEENLAAVVQCAR